MVGRLVLRIQRYDIGYRDEGRRADAGRCDSGVLAVEVAFEGSLSSCTIVNAAACALFVIPVADKPDGVVVQLAIADPSLLAEQKMGSLVSTRHSSLILWMLASV